VIGAIADDFTGATDLAGNLVRSGHVTVVVADIDAADPRDLQHADAVVVALKSRTAPVAQAVADSLEAQQLLASAGANRYYFKYCSTFDSTDVGNIGPVLDALMQRLGVLGTIAVPSFPGNGRTVYFGQLFVHGQLLEDSPMRDHPITPMRESHIPSLLARQTHATVRLVDWHTVQRGAAAVESVLTSPCADPTVFVIDSLTDADLRVISEASRSIRLVSGSSGLGLALPGRHIGTSYAPLVPAGEGKRVVLCGSASETSRVQVEWALDRAPGVQVDVGRFRDDPASELHRLLDFLETAWSDDHACAPMIYAVRRGDRLPEDDTVRACDAALVERLFGDLAAELMTCGVRHLMVAGGETSGSVTTSLGVTHLAVGTEISAGVPWMNANCDGVSINLALKSGNFGRQDIFCEGWDHLG
jgi:3-dehydrotetronate 4-kinase